MARLGGGGGLMNPRIPAGYRPKLPAPKPSPSLRFPVVGKLPAGKPGLARPVGGLAPPKPPAKPKLPVSPYANPFTGDTGVVGQRIDQGVDYSAPSGTAVRALGPGRIVSAQSTGSGWPGGGFIGEQLTAGPAKGQVSYIAEDIQPAVTQGQTVKAGQTIGYFTPGGSIETGWGTLPPNVGQALAYGTQSAPGSDPGAYSTGFGIAYNKLLTALGAPSGTLQSTISGTAAPKFSSTGGKVVGVKPTPAPVVPPGAFTPTFSPVAGSVSSNGRGGSISLAAARRGATLPTAATTPSPAFGGATVPISTGSLTGNVINNGLPGFTPSTQGPATPVRGSAGAWLIGAAVLGGLVYVMVKRQS